MSKLEKLVEAPVASSESEEGPPPQPKISGIVFRPIDAEKAMRLLGYLSDLGIEGAVALTEATEGQSLAPRPIHFQSAGFVLQPINVEAALRALNSLSEGAPEEQRETFEHLPRALNETRAANGERLVFPDKPDEIEEIGASSEEPEKTSPIQPNYSGVTFQSNLNVSGLVLPPFNPVGAIAVLQSFFEGDLEEQRETLEYLKRALNEDRAAGGERLLFPDE